MKIAADNIMEKVPFELRKLHQHYLFKEQSRLEAIKRREEELKNKLAEERAQRRTRRHLLRVCRGKRRLKEEIEAKIFSKKSVEGDVLSLKLVSFSDKDDELKKFRTYGGIIYEFWVLLSYAREAVNTKIDPPLEKFLVQDEDIKKFVVNFLSDPAVKERNIRLDINEKYRSEVEAALHHMETDLVSFNETKEETISNLIQHEDLVVSASASYCMRHAKLEPMAYHYLLLNLLRIYFKSNDYRVVEDTTPVAGQDDGDKDGKQDQGGNQDGTLNTSLPVPDPQLVKQPSNASNHHLGDEQSALKSAGTGGRRKSYSKMKVGPEITEEDRRMEALKKKLDVVFVTPHEHIADNTVAIFRVREALARDELRPEVKKAIDEEKERKKQEADAIHDPKKDIEFHRKQYLLDEYMSGLKNKEELQKKAEEDAEAKRKEDHIEQYYGDAYEKDFANYDFEEADRAPSNINETLTLENNREVLFIHRVNQGLFRHAIIDKMRETFKEIALIKDINLDKKILPLDKEIEDEVLRGIVPNKDDLPIFDVEL